MNAVFQHFTYLHLKFYCMFLSLFCFRSSISLIVFSMSNEEVLIYVLLF